MSGARWFSTFDLRSSYYQMLLDLSQDNLLQTGRHTQIQGHAV